jgi:hypothetical protein
VETLAGGLVDDLDTGRLTWDPQTLLDLANRARTDAGKEGA